MTDTPQPREEAICRTCGGKGGNHVPSPLDAKGIGHPAHKMWHLEVNLSESATFKPWPEVKSELLKNPEIKAAYDATPAPSNEGDVERIVDTLGNGALWCVRSDDTLNGEHLAKLKLDAAQAINQLLLEARKVPETVTRFELIDHSKWGQGRIVVRYDAKVELSYQDNDRTLKVFLSDRPPFNKEIQ